MDPGFRREANWGKARHADAPAPWGFPFMSLRGVERRSNLAGPSATWREIARSARNHGYRHRRYAERALFPATISMGCGTRSRVGDSAPLLFQSADSLIERQQASISALMLRGHRAELLGHRVLGGFQAQQNRRLHGHLVAELADLGPELALFIEHPLKLSGEKFEADGAVAIGHVATPVVGHRCPGPTSI